MKTRFMLLASALVATTASAIATAGTIGVYRVGEEDVTSITKSGFLESTEVLGSETDATLTLTENGGQLIEEAKEGDTIKVGENQSFIIVEQTGSQEYLVRPK
jgi:hypothetical protein